MSGGLCMPRALDAEDRLLIQCGAAAAISRRYEWCETPRLPNACVLSMCLGMKRMIALMKRLHCEWTVRRVCRRVRVVRGGEHSERHHVSWGRVLLRSLLS